MSIPPATFPISTLSPSHLPALLPPALHPNLHNHPSMPTGVTAPIRPTGPSLRSGLSSSPSHGPSSPQPIHPSSKTLPSASQTNIRMQPLSMSSSFPPAIHTPSSNARSPRMHSTLFSSTHALLALGDLPATATSPRTAIVSKTYCHRDIARHNLAPAIQAERAALVRLSATGSNHVARLLSAAVTTTGVTLTMQRLPGRALSTLSRPLSSRHVARIARGIIIALKDIHGANVTHGDLTLRNVLVEGDEIFVVDFGAAFVQGLEWRDPTHGTSANVLPPECLDGGAPDPTADIWALGILIWMLTFGGCGPFGCDDGDAATLRRLELFAKGEIEIEEGFWQECDRLKNMKSERWEEEEMEKVLEFVKICLNRDAGRRFTKGGGGRDMVDVAWCDLIDYEDMLAQPFLQNVSDDDCECTQRIRAPCE